MSDSYESLNDEEKAALWGSLLADPAAGRLMLKRLTPSYSKSTYYRYYNQGIDSLKQKGLLDTSQNPVEIAFRILPLSMLKQVIETLRARVQRMEEDGRKSMQRSLELEYEVRSLRDQVDKQGIELENVRPLQSLIQSFEKSQVDDNWIRASIALNLVEPAIKKKLEELGVKLPAQTKFGEIYSQLLQVLKEIPNRLC
ncbi:unnamed protein product [marine sediment metagenome]|uniref:Uncharacterized protein n=1 Tax=marine sediment metagenome TaxID=412755 RepID=X1HRY6_9ZZZZ